VEFFCGDSEKPSPDEGEDVEQVTQTLKQIFHVCVSFLYYLLYVEFLLVKVLIFAFD